MKLILKIILAFNFFLLYSVAFPQDNNDLKIHCEGEGEGKGKGRDKDSPVYLIGGGPAFTTRNLQPIQKKLSKYHKVCRWDMRGVGENSGFPLNQKESVLSQWIEDMDKVLPHQKVVLWGHYWGALQAMLFAKKYPDRVSRLILSNPVDPSLLRMENIEKKLISHPENDAKLTLDEIETPAEKRHIFRSKIASYFLNGEQGWVYASRFSPQDSNNHLNVKIWDEYKKNPLMEKDVKQLKNKIVGVIHCRDDVLHPESLAEYRRLLSRNKHHFVSGCAHFPWEESPAEYYRVLSDLVN